MRVRIICMFFAALISVAGAIPTQAGIEAVKGKKYTLTKQHGPWMVMVAVFSELPEELRSEGMNSEQAADELVYELRTKGIPAYTYRREQKLESIDTTNRLNQVEKRQYKLDTEICVLAGNYSSIEGENSLGKRTLEWLKDYKPACLKNTAVYRPTPGQPGPLGGAFLSVNPMLNPEEVKRRQRDPEIIRFNSNTEFSLLDNPGKYTIVVASFYGNSVTQVGGDDSGADKLGRCGLDLAEIQAWQVMKALRERGMDAYVFHDRKKSIVTVGEFNSTNDPGVQTVYKTFTAQWKTDPVTGQPQLLAESLPLSGENGQWLCTFDPKPTMIEVPYKH
ncbi:hypothetical protein [Rubinisphaera sp.]|uniref:hypothetical protein n=1 Tax=Rubinisphaera sp. TaxID=2024857 RepID=UPI000C11C78F|nr:hypothetical protein [Rubinisphaera sp.]MBV11671.1 hypothetical protein [Rubinisphaera sp.]HCS54839.1 hypothetical protein [Planctomycetaceae bacterium]